MLILKDDSIIDGILQPAAREALSSLNEIVREEFGVEGALSEERLLEAMHPVMNFPLCLYVRLNSEIEILCQERDLRIKIVRRHKGEWFWRVFGVIGLEKAVQFKEE